MGMSDTPSAERVHIGFFGRRNAGKSCVVNAITGQGLSVVSDTLGTTTDPVRKSMELLPLGPVVVIDTPGFDDVGTLGQRRVHATRRVLDQTDLAVLVVDATQGLGACDEQLIGLFRSHDVPYVVAYNKRDLLSALPEAGAHDVYVSGLTGEGIGALKERIAAIGTAGHDVLPMLLDLVGPDDLVVLVVPIDKAAPRGRLILPSRWRCATCWTPVPSASWCRRCAWAGRSSGWPHASPRSSSRTARSLVPSRASCPRTCG